MKKRKYLFIGAVLILISVIGLIFIPRSIPVTINGEQGYLNTNALTVSKALEKDGFKLSAEDQVTPPGESLLWGVGEIKIDLARPVKIQIYPQNKKIELLTAERSPRKILEIAGIVLGNRDQLLMSGEKLPEDQLLPYEGEYDLVVRKAVKIDLNDAGEISQIISSAETLSQVLAENGIQIQPGDRISPDPDTIIEGDLPVEIERAREYNIQMKDETIKVRSAAENVAEVLTEAGLALQGLDYSIPQPDAPVPSDGNIRLVRVREEFILSQTNLPFSVEYERSDQVELDKREIIQPGEFGVEVTRTRVTYEDNQEVNRVEETTWVAKEPKDQVTGLGTKVVVQTMDTPNGPIEYWRAVNVYATSYSPCRLGIENYCSSGTSSGLTVQHGVIAVTRAWYNLMVGQRIYVPGYGIGVIGDVGGGVSGKYWIDLAYSDSDYVAWYHNITIYFLTPVPANIPWILP